MRSVFPERWVFAGRGWVGAVGQWQPQFGKRSGLSGFWRSLSCLSLPQLHISMLGDPWQLGDPESPESVALAGVGHHLGAEKGHVVAWEPVQRANAALRARRRF